MTIKSRRGPNVTPDEHKLVVKFAKQCLKEICKKQYEIEYQGNPAVYADAIKRIPVRTHYRRPTSLGDTYHCHNRRYSRSRDLPDTAHLPQPQTHHYHTPTNPSILHYSTTPTP